MRVAFHIGLALGLVLLRGSDLRNYLYNVR